MMKKLRYRLEGILCLILIRIFRIMPLDMASATGGFLAQSIGFFMVGASRKADKHLRYAMPDLTPPQRRTIVQGMWNNLGRVFAEYPHLEQIARERTNVINPQNIATLKDNPTGAVFIGLHQGNWEIWAAMALLKFDVQVDITYRAPNNPIVDNLVSECRSLGGRITGHPKTASSGRKIMSLLKNKGNIAILIDQKYNPGLDIPFFGYNARTNPIAFQLAQKYDCPLIACQCIRTKGANFEMIFHPPIPTKDEDGEPFALEELIKDTHIMVEDWIRQNPGQWIWLHKRWRNLNGNKEKE